VVAEGGNFTLGQELAGRGGFTTYNLADWDLTNDETLIAGQASAIGLSIQGVSEAQLQAIRVNMLQTADLLRRRDDTSLTGEKLVGDVLAMGMALYLRTLENRALFARNQFAVVDLPGLSYGLFHSLAQPVKVFGLVTTAVKFPGLLMDVGHLRYVRTSKTNNADEWLRYNQARGNDASMLESDLPESMVSDKQFCNPRWGQPTTGLANCAQGISATKALALAQLVGQRVYSISQSNISQLSAIQTSTELRDQLRSAIQSGKDVRIHQAPVTVGNWLGHGYVISDPVTGAASYEISGGARGGFVDTLSNADGYQKYVLTPIIVLAATLAKLKSFADSFGNFAGLFSFLADIIDFSFNCQFNVGALIGIWTLNTLASLLFLNIFVLLSLSIWWLILLGIAVNVALDNFKDYVKRKYFGC
jgi:hypothetical protein